MSAGSRREFLGALAGGTVAAAGQPAEALRQVDGLRQFVRRPFWSVGNGWAARWKRRGPGEPRSRE
jgi:hypothetical protein